MSPVTLEGRDRVSGRERRLRVSGWAARTSVYGWAAQASVCGCAPAPCGDEMGGRDREGGPATSTATGEERAAAGRGREPL